MERKISKHEILSIIRISLLSVFFISMLSYVIIGKNISPSKIATVYVGTWLQAIPFLTIGILLSIAIQVFVPRSFFSKVFPKNQVVGLIIGVVAGFFLPVCDCASIPVFRSLVKKGVPVSAAVAFMVSAPCINPVVMLSTYYAYGNNIKMVFARVGLGIICSFIIGLCFTFNDTDIFKKDSKSHDDHCDDDNCCCDHCNHDHHSNKLVEFISGSKDEFFEISGFLLIGIGVSTLFQLIMPKNVGGSVSIKLIPAMIVMMLFAFLLSLCSSSDAIVGKTLGSAFPMGATLAFLVFGPMLDVKNLILMSGTFSKKFVIRVSITISVVCFVVTLLASLFGIEAFVR